MDTNNMYWVISFASDGPKIEVHSTPHSGSKRKGTVPMEFPSAKEMQPAEWDSGIYLNKEKGSRIAMIRIIYALCRENLLVDVNGKPAPDCRIFRMFGQMMHADFSRYSNDLNRSMEDNTDMYTQTEIFRRMQENFLKRFNLS